MQANVYPSQMVLSVAFTPSYEVRSTGLQQKLAKDRKLAWRSSTSGIVRNY